MQSDLAQQSMSVRQFTGLFKTGHIGHQRGTRDHTVLEGLYNSPVGLRTHPEIVRSFVIVWGWAYSIAAFDVASLGDLNTRDFALYFLRRTKSALQDQL
jgi:hypothetical protein